MSKQQKNQINIITALVAALLVVVVGLYFIQAKAANKTADLNNDGTVSILDLSILLSAWNRTGTQTADINNDSIVNILDLSVLLSKWGTSGVPPTPPPSPLGGCTVSGIVAPCIGSVTSGSSGWGAPVFSDEFNGTALDTTKWAPCWYPESFSGDRCGVMNESTTDKRNVTVSGGAAILTQAGRDSGALINSDPDAGTHAGFMMSFAGYAEARVWFPGSGSTIYNWPAWWINGPESGFWDGEIDVAEGLGSMTSNYHYDRGAGHIANNSGTITGTWSNGWHIYAVHRKAGENIIYYDGVEIRRYTTYDNLAPESLIFNVGTKESRTMVYGTASQVKIDYVRVWKQ